MDDVVTRVNQQLLGAFHPPRKRYKSVQVLTIYWEKSGQSEEKPDNRPFAQEASAISTVFTDAFGFYVHPPFEIPPTKSQLALDNRIGDLILKAGDPENLLIIHYGGHGDEDNGEDRQREAVWAACVKLHPVGQEDNQTKGK